MKITNNKFYQTLFESVASSNADRVAAIWPHVQNVRGMKTKDVSIWHHGR